VAHAMECAFRPVACAECGALCSQRRLVAHAAACPGVRVRCPAGCGEVLLRGTLARHAATVCPSRTVACDWHAFGASRHAFPRLTYAPVCAAETHAHSRVSASLAGCNVRMLRADAHAHAQSDAPLHAAMLARAVTSLQTGAAATVEQVEALRAELAAARSLAEDVAAATSRDMAATRAAAAADAAALRAEIDQLHAALALKADARDMAAAQQQVRFMRSAIMLTLATR
jgi:hypothetical protein